MMCQYLPSRATEMIDESVLYDKLESKLISLHALIGTATKRTSRVKRGAFRNKIQRVAKRKYPACIKQVVTTTSLSPVPPRCRVNQLSLLSILSCIWLVTWENKLHITLVLETLSWSHHFKQTTVLWIAPLLRTKHAKVIKKNTSITKTRSFVLIRLVDFPTDFSYLN